MSSKCVFLNSLYNWYIFYRINWYILKIKKMDQFKKNTQLGKQLTHFRQIKKIVSKMRGKNCVDRN